MSVKKININLPDQDVIEYIEYLLKRARDGEIQSIAAVGSRGDRTTFYGWVRIDKNSMAIIGEIEKLKMSVLDTVSEIVTYTV